MRKIDNDGDVIAVEMFWIAKYHFIVCDITTCKKQIINLTLPTDSLMQLTNIIFRVNYMNDSCWWVNVYYHILAFHLGSIHDFTDRTDC